MGGDFPQLFSPQNRSVGVQLSQTCPGPWLNPALGCPQPTKGVCVCVCALGQSDYSGSAGESQGFPFPQPQRISQNGASTCPSFSLGLPLLEPGWLGLAFQRPGSGSLSVWLSGPSFYISSGFRGLWLRGIQGPRLTGSACLLVCLTLGPL